MRKELLQGLTEEQIEKIKACKNSDELLALAKAEGIELTDEQLEVVSGGGLFCATTPLCPRCGSNRWVMPNDSPSQYGPDKRWQCTDCKIYFNEFEEPQK